MEYGIGINNRYAFLTGDDEHDPLEAVAAKDKENKKVAAATSGQTVSAPKPSAPKPAVNKQNSSAAPSNLKKPDGQGQNTRQGGNQRGGDNRPGNRDQRPKGDRIIRQSNQGGEGGPGGRREGGERPEGGYRGPRPDRPPRREGDDNQERRNNFRNRREQDGDAPRPFRQNNDNNVAFGTEGRPDDFRPKRSEGGNFRGGNRERGGFRGRGGVDGGGGRGGNRRREYDRHSGSNTTGVKAEDKRGGSGSYNWGTTQDDVEAQTAEPTETLERSGDEQGLAGATDAPTSGDEAPAADVEETVKELTLEEYRKIEEEKRFKSNLKLRKAGEGEDSKQWKKTFLLPKTKEEEEEVEYEEIIIVSCFYTPCSSFVSHQIKPASLPVRFFNGSLVCMPVGRENVGFSLHVDC